MRYGVTVNDHRGLSGSRDEVRSIIVGVLLTAGVDQRTIREQADEVLRRADVLPSDETQGVRLASIGELHVWRERGREAPGRVYQVKVGDIGPSFRATTQGMLVAYVMALMVGDGIEPDKAAALGRLVADTLSEGGHYPDHRVTELKDGRDVLVWWEDET